MDKEQLKELQEYNLEYLEAHQSEEIFGGDYTSAIELKYANKEIKRLNNIINELEKVLDRSIKLNYYKNNVRQYNKTLTEGAIMYRDYIKEKLQELKVKENKYENNNI